MGLVADYTADALTVLKVALWAILKANPLFLEWIRLLFKAFALARSKLYIWWVPSMERRHKITEIEPSSLARLLSRERKCWPCSYIRTCSTSTRVLTRHDEKRPKSSPLTITPRIFELKNRDSVFSRPPVLNFLWSRVKTLVTSVHKRSTRNCVIDKTTREHTNIAFLQTILLW